MHKIQIARWLNECEAHTLGRWVRNDALYLLNGEVAPGSPAPCVVQGK